VLRSLIIAVAIIGQNSICFLSEVHYLTALMAPVNIFKFPISSPADTSPLEELKRLGYDPSQILGVVGKTEGALLVLICLVRG
jgi:Amidohydrolase ring-opening protein (Amido_AtzD_TrzD)